MKFVFSGISFHDSVVHWGLVLLTNEGRRCRRSRVISPGLPWRLLRFSLYLSFLCAFGDSTQTLSISSQNHPDNCQIRRSLQILREILKVRLKSYDCTTALNKSYSISVFLKNIRLKVNELLFFFNL